MTTRLSSRAPLLAALTAVMLMTAGCATETTYRPATGTGFARQGYSDHQIEGNRWVVSFAGNSYTSRGTVEKYLLYRAAQLTVQQGYDHFVMADRKTDHRTRTYANDFGPYGYGGWGPTWRYRGRGFGWRSWDPYWGDPFWDNGLDIQTVDKYEANAEIVLGKGPKPANIHAFDARDVIDHLGPSIILPK